MTGKNARLKIESILIIFILITVIFPILSVPDTTGDLSNPSSLKTHNPIFIQSDSQFTVLNGVVKGSGTKNNPHIIENWKIKKLFQLNDNQKIIDI